MARVNEYSIFHIGERLARFRRIGIRGSSGRVAVKSLLSCGDSIRRGYIPLGSVLVIGYVPTFVGCAADCCRLVIGPVVAMEGLDEIGQRPGREDSRAVGRGGNCWAVPVCVHSVTDSPAGYWAGK